MASLMQLTESWPIVVALSHHSKHFDVNKCLGGFEGASSSDSKTGICHSMSIIIAWMTGVDRSSCWYEACWEPL